MFSINPRAGLLVGVLMAAGGHATAVQPPVNHPAGPSVAASVPDADRYLETELDWRSYHVNRLNAQRNARERGVRVLDPTPPAGTDS